MTIVDLFARIGLKTDEAKAKSFAKSMNTVKTGLIAVTGVAAGTALAIRKITSDALNAAVAFNQLQVETGINTSEFQKWQSVVEQTGQPIESVTAAVKALADAREKIKLGQGNISGYQLLGVDPNQDPLKILEDLRTKIKDLDPAMKKNALSQLGVGAGLLQTLELTNEQFNQMASNAFIISPSAIKTMNQTKASIDLASRAINYMKAQITVGLSPQILLLTKRVTTFIQKNEDGIIEGFKLGFKWVSKFTGAIINTVTGIDDLITKTVGWKVGIMGVLGAVALLNSALLLSPIGLMTAGLLLLIAIMDDLYIYSQGGKSLFGDFMEKSEGFSNFIDKILEGIKAIKEWEERTGTIKSVVQKTKDAIIPSAEGKSRLEAGMAARQAKDLELKSMSKKEYLASLKDSFLNLIGKGGDTTNNMNMVVNGSNDPETTGRTAFRMMEDSLNAASAQIPRDE